MEDVDIEFKIKTKPKIVGWKSSFRQRIQPRLLSVLKKQTEEYGRVTGN